MLDFENEIFLDAFHEDGLLIMSRGLGLSRIFTELVRIYSDPASLVLVLNTTPADEQFSLRGLKHLELVKFLKL